MEDWVVCCCSGWLLNMVGGDIIRVLPYKVVEICGALPRIEPPLGGPKAGNLAVGGAPRIELVGG